MDRLPDLPLLMIFQCIDDYQERIKLERVCKKWRQILLKDGWNHVRRIELSNAKLIGPIGDRCGGHLVEWRFYGMDIDSALIPLIVNNFPALKQLEFRHCKLKRLSANALELFRELGTRLRSLTFYQTDCQYDMQLHPLLCNLSRLQHLGMCLQYIDYLPNHFFAELRSLYLSSGHVAQMLVRVHKESPRLTALYLDFSVEFSRRSLHLLSRITDLKSLRFLGIAFNYFAENWPTNQQQQPEPELLGSFFSEMPQLLALHVKMSIKHLSDAFRFPVFRNLVHLSLAITRRPISDNFEPIGLLSVIAPQLRSLSLDLTGYSLDLAQRIGSEVLKIASNGALEFLNVPHASFTVGEFEKLISPNLHTIGAQLRRNEQSTLFLIELQRIVGEQCRVGTRTRFPLRVWVYGGHHEFSWRDHLLTVHTVQNGFAPPNPVLAAFFRDEVFNDSDAGGTPSFVTEHYSSRA